MFGTGGSSGIIGWSWISVWILQARVGSGEEKGVLATSECSKFNRDQ